jgi:hypothetical protein
VVFPSPRASERAVAAIGSLAWKGFLVSQFLSLSRLFFSTKLGDGVTVLASAAGLLSVGLLFGAVVIYGMRAGDPFGALDHGARVWASLLFLVSGLLSFYGWLVRGYAAAPVAHDLAPYLVILGAVVLGSIPQAWEDADRLLLVLFTLGLLLNVVGMTEMSRVVSEADSEDRAGIGIVAYRTQGVLAFWPFYLLTARLRGSWVALLTFLGVFFVLAQQILFQKRAPTVRIAVFTLVFLIVLPHVAPVRARLERRARVLFFASGLVVATAALSIAPWLFAGQFEGLMHRLSGQAYEGGAAAMLTTENERFFEASIFFRSLDIPDIVFGHGFGGYFKPSVAWWGVWLDDVREYGRRQLHVGSLMPFFKGGLVLTCVYYAGVFMALRRGWRARRDPIAGALFLLLFVHTVFLIQESWFVMSVSFDMVMVGLSMGYLLSLESSPAPEALP